MISVSAERTLMIVIFSLLLHSVLFSLLSALLKIVQMILMMFLTLVMTKMFVVLYSWGNTTMLMKIVMQQ